MNSIIERLSTRHFLINLITVMVFVGGIISWNTTNKEELPDVTFNFVRVSTVYSGASAEDVEFFITQPIEEVLQGLDGVRKITSTSGAGASSISVELSSEVTDIDSMITEIQNQVSSVQLPEDVLDDPRVRVFETSKKAIIDIAIYRQDQPLLSVQDRAELQHYARGLETKLLNQNQIFEVRRQGYLKEEVSINVNPNQLFRYEIPLNTVVQELQRSHVRAPAGTLKSGSFEQVTLLSELDTKAKMDKLVVQGGFDSKAVQLSALATITDGFEEQRSIFKVNGREAVMFNVVKNSSYGILESLETVKKVVEQYKRQVLPGTKIEMVFLDDESIDVRNRLSIIASNGLLGFCLILGALFLFLNKRSGFWVAVGIPFTLCFTLIAGQFLGYTINGVTLAAIIIVLGIVVDDAIIVAENISRRFNDGESIADAAVKGTQEVVAPIVASILTTCAAFIPLYFFTGRFGNFVQYIPAVIFLMLLASLVESFLLLPGHMTMFPRKRKVSVQRQWFSKLEDRYEGGLQRLLRNRYWVVLGMIVLMFGTTTLAQKEFKFVMFPDEESREIVLSGQVDGATSAIETATKIQPIEDILVQYIGKEGVGLRTDVARGRRGDASIENQFRTTLEIVPKEERKKTGNELVAEIKEQVEKIPGISRLAFRKSRFGQSSGSVFEIIVAENDDLKREALVQDVMTALKQDPNITNVEPDVIPLQDEYLIDFKQDELKRLSVNPSSIATTLRTVLNGRRIFTLIRNDEEIDVNITVESAFREDMSQVLKVPVENNRNYLIPLGNIVSSQKIQAKKSIRRQDEKRSSFIYADLSEGSTQSPLEVADYLEAEVFPKLLAGYPTARIGFEGEVLDSRESKRDLLIGVSVAIGLIYLILGILFDSAVKPLRIMLVIPFGVIGVILAFYAHQKLAFGFYAAIGTLGMLGVVVNDAIVMLDKLDKSSDDDVVDVIKTAAIAKTRLRAISLTTLTTVAGVMPTAYGIGGYDAMLSDMMIAMAWGLLFGTMITLVLTPCAFLIERDLKGFVSKWGRGWGLTAMILVISVFSFPNPIQAKEQVINLNDFIVQASQKDTVFHALLYDRYYFKYDQARNVEAAELALEIGSDFVVNTTESGDVHSIALSQTLPKFGQSVSASYTKSSTGTETKSIVFSQDIAQNAFGRATRLDSRIQGLKTDIAKHQLVEAYEDYLAELITLFYTWTRQYESVNLAKAAYSENEKVLKSILDRQQKKIANETDVNKLTLQTLAKKEQVIDFEKRYLDTTFQIQRALGLAPGTRIRPDTKISIDALPKKIEESLISIKQESRTFKILDQIEDQVGLEVDREADDLLPSAKLSASFVENSERYGLVGLSVSMPALNKKSKADYASSKLNQQQTVLESLSTAQRVEVSLRSLHQGLYFQKRLIEIATQKRRVAQQILNAESENYSYGKITLNDYIDAVNRYDTARFSEIDRKITYQTLSIEWKRLTDQLVQKNIESL